MILPMAKGAQLACIIAFEVSGPSAPLPLSQYSHALMLVPSFLEQVYVHLVA